MCDGGLSRAAVQTALQEAAAAPLPRDSVDGGGGGEPRGCLSAESAATRDGRTTAAHCVTALCRSPVPFGACS